MDVKTAVDFGNFNVMKTTQTRTKHSLGIVTRNGIPL